MSAAEPQRDLILAAVEGYDWDAMRPFVTSLRAVGYTGEVRFFASNLSQETLRELRRAGIDVERPPLLWRLLGSRRLPPYRNAEAARWRWHVHPLYTRGVSALAALSRDRRRTRARLAGVLPNLMVARFFWYFAYLSRGVGRYRNVMLTDVRDVLFLGHPFDFEVGDSVHVFLEDETQTIATHPPSRGWLVSAYGEDVFDELGARSIICAGVTIGAASAVLRYLGVMVDALASVHRPFDGIDQGVHNYVVHKGLVPDVAIDGNLEGPVLTVAIMDGERARSLTHARRTEARVIHQHDRHPALRDELEAELGA